MDKIILYVAAVFVGASIGSFANAAAMRTCADKKWWGRERSVCDSCGTVLSPHELVPLVSYILLGGRCRHCGKKIYLRHFVAEVLCAVAALIFFVRFGLSYQFVVLLAALVFAAFHTMTDIEAGYIYDSWSFAMALCGIAMRLPFGLRCAADGVIGCAAGACVILAIIAASRGKMGFGDATLMAGIGAFMGLKFCILSLYLGFMSGGAVVLPLIAVKKLTRKSEVPLAPFLCIGMLLASVFGEYIVEYFGFAADLPWCTECNAAFWKN
ncbi:MAG: prepilin peptidase [Synergistes sp.]|nr:prepilin peptidase [Synergistes sp.]